MLEINNLTAGYGPVTVLHQVSIGLSEGEIVCIIGPNGAGKSTVLRAVAGQLESLTGKIIFRGEDVINQSIEEKGRKGLIFIPQGNNIFPNLTVIENLEIAGSILRDSERMYNGIKRVLEKFSMLNEKKKRPARELSGGQRQILALSRILILGPRLVLLDEPSLGLAPLIVDIVFKEIQEMNRKGISFLLVEQNARKGLSISHRGYVLELGKNRLAGTGEGLLNNIEVQRLYLGG
ncbi:MAG: ABC transporter ATP-binding protein [Thermodesulfobacteriota bacterium]|nr:ABC transporter ATP-binding protein [Thermodesulfobacteriota bacterium]